MSTAMKASRWVAVAEAAAVSAAGRLVVGAGGHTLLLVAGEDAFHALDNRCPHMGFPLSRGTVDDGLIVCHWHHARFDLCSGGTLDPFADDVRAYPVRVRAGQIEVDLVEHRGDVEYWQRRLREGMEQSLSLVICKAVLALLALGRTGTQILGLAGEYGLAYRDSGWGSGMTILTALGNMLPLLHGDDQAIAIAHAVIRAAQDCSGRPPRFPVEPLPSGGPDAGRLEAWFRRAVDVRDEEGAERSLRSALAAPAGARAAAEMLYAAATDHLFIDGGHEVDFITKALEYVDFAGEGQAAAALSSLVGGLCHAQHSEEQYAWRYPVDLTAILRPVMAKLERLNLAQCRGPVADLDGLAGVLLGEDPAAMAATLLERLQKGVAPAALGRAVAYAAALRLARFPLANEFGDWDSVHNTWSGCHALYQALVRAPSVALVRGLFHAGMALYLDRFLNVPPARLPEERQGAGVQTSAQDLLAELAALFDRQQEVDGAAGCVHSYLAGGHDPAGLIATLGHLTLREDAGFHMYQTLEAGSRLYLDLAPIDVAAARRVLVGVTRYLAAHAPTARALNQTVRIALRLSRGEQVFDEEPA